MNYSSLIPKTKTLADNLAAYVNLLHEIEFLKDQRIELNIDIEQEQATLSNIVTAGRAEYMLKKVEKLNQIDSTIAGRQEAKRDYERIISNAIHAVGGRAINSEVEIKSPRGGTETVIFYFTIENGSINVSQFSK